MKSSSSDHQPGENPHQRIQAFVYRDWSVAPEGLAVAVEDADPSDADADASEPVVLDEAGRREHDEIIRQQAWNDARDQLWPEAQRQAERALGEVYTQRLEAEHAALTAALDEFTLQRQHYFAQLEREVVQLVLAVARKIMHREAQIDPLLLAGTVRVALDPLASAAAVDLVVAPSQQPLWEQRLAADHDLSSRVRLRTDPVLEPYGCRLATENGFTDLSWESQLREVEKGFLDLLRRRDQAELAGATAATRTHRSEAAPPPAPEPEPVAEPASTAEPASAPEPESA